MKKLGAFIVISLIALTSKAQAPDFPMDQETHKVNFVEVVQAPGLTRSQLFDRALGVLHKMYKQADSKIVVKDKDNGIIVVNGFTQILIRQKNGTMLPIPELMLYKLTISFKDNKYRYEFTEFVQNRAGTPNHIEKWIEHDVPGDKYYGPEDHIHESLEFVYNDIQQKIKELKTGMLGEKSVEKKDW